MDTEPYSSFIFNFLRGFFPLSPPLPPLSLYLALGYLISLFFTYCLLFFQHTILRWWVQWVGQWWGSSVWWRGPVVTEPRWHLFSQLGAPSQAVPCQPQTEARYWVHVYNREPDPTSGRSIRVHGFLESRIPRLKPPGAPLQRFHEGYVKVA